MEDLSYACRMAEWRIDRAKNHINHLEKIIEWIVHPDNYGIITEQDANTGTYGIRIGPSTGGIPHHLPIVMGEIVHHLAACLDYLWSALARSVGIGGASRIHFPRHETRQNLEDMVSKAPLVAKIPAAGPFIIDTLRPYKDGNFPLWAVGKLDNIDKHRLLLSTLTIGKLGKFVATADDGSVIDLSYSTINSHGPSLSLGFACPFEINDDAELTPLVAFDESRDIPAGQPVMQTLVDFTKAVSEAHEAFKETFV